jgi:predicted MFS family arabinose efflux permease
MTTRTIVALGVGQCVNWGVLYYAFGVLLTPIQRDLGVPVWVLGAAFSVALLMSALLAPTVGKWSDQGAGLQLVRLGGYLAGLLLLAWALIPGVPAMFVIWAGLGLCMAATLYEPVFIVVGRTVSGPAERLRALATVTVFGGLASTVFLPLTSALVESLGWRGAVGVLAVVLVLSTHVCSRIACSALPATPPEPERSRAGAPSVQPRLRAILAIFAVASLASTAFTTTLVPALLARELTPMTSAWVAGLLGLMQLPGRLLVMNGSLSASPSRLLVVSLLSQAAGICVIATSSSTLTLGAGVTLFAVGAGLMTLARPHLVQTAFSATHAGYVNGRLAGAQGLARAGGPVLAVGLASIVGYGATFVLLAATVMGLAVASTVVLDV